MKPSEVGGVMRPVWKGEFASAIGGDEADDGTDFTGHIFLLVLQSKRQYQSRKRNSAQRVGCSPLRKLLCTVPVKLQRRSDDSQP